MKVHETSDRTSKSHMEIESKAVHQRCPFRKFGPLEILPGDFPCFSGNNSLLAPEGSLFGCAGNLFGCNQLTYSRKPNRLPAFAARSAKFPCIFPRISEFEPREPFAKDCQHSHAESFIQKHLYALASEPNSSRIPARFRPLRVPLKRQRRLHVEFPRALPRISLGGIVRVNWLEPPGEVP
jgi:hypothetical protein